MGFARTLDWSYFVFLGSTGLLQVEKGNVLVRVGFVLMASVHMDRSRISVLLYVLRRTMRGTMFMCLFLVIFTNCILSFLPVMASTTVTLIDPYNTKR